MMSSLHDGLLRQNCCQPVSWYFNSSVGPMLIISLFKLPIFSGQRFSASLPAMQDCNVKRWEPNIIVSCIAPDRSPPSLAWVVTGQPGGNSNHVSNGPCLVESYSSRITQENNINLTTYRLTLGHEFLNWDSSPVWSEAMFHMVYFPSHSVWY